MKFSVDQLLQQGIKAHKAGHIQKAKQLYLSVLAEKPKHPDANHNWPSVPATQNYHLLTLRSH